jgi:tetraprenyl-beta-curcumene synthase
LTFLLFSALETFCIHSAMALQGRFDPLTDPRPGPRMVRIGDRLALAGTFAAAARRYWLTVFPQLGPELSRWRERAAEIPDPVLRRLAFDAQRKRGNLEGAAAFAAFAPRSRRAAVLRALVAFQAAYDYLDVLAEQPQADPVAGARGLHQALIDALDPGLGGGSEQPDYYASYPQHEDGGYLADLVSACRTALATLPTYAVVAAPARRAAERIVEFQTCNLSRSQGDHDALERWAHGEIPAGTDLRWWETAAAGGSSLGVHALIAAAADGGAMQAEAVEQIEHAYFPWIGGLHSMLDHLIDQVNDAAVGERNLIDYYASPAEAAARMQALAQRAVSAARALPRGRRHTIVLTGMAGFYLSDPQASAPAASPIAQNVRAAIGGLMTPTLIVFKARFAARLATTSSVRDERDSPVALRFER